MFSPSENQRRGELSEHELIGVRLCRPENFSANLRKARNLRTRQLIRIPHHLNNHLKTCLVHAVPVPVQDAMVLLLHLALIEGISGPPMSRNSRLLPTTSLLSRFGCSTRLVLQQDTLLEALLILMAKMWVVALVALSAVLSILDL